MKLSPQELGLYRQCINELLGGFHAPAMEQVVGVSYALLMKEDAAFYALSKASAGAEEIEPPVPVRARIIEEAMRQLGRQEFRMRTGCSWEDGDRLIEKLRKAA